MSRVLLYDHTRSRQPCLNITVIFPKGASGTQRCATVGHFWDDNSCGFTHLQHQLNDSCYSWGRYITESTSGSFTRDSSNCRRASPVAGWSSSALSGNQRVCHFWRYKAESAELWASLLLCVAAGRRPKAVMVAAVVVVVGRDFCTNMTLQLSSRHCKNTARAVRMYRDLHGNESGAAFLKLKLNLSQGRTASGII